MDDAQKSREPTRGINIFVMGKPLNMVVSLLRDSRESLPAKIIAIRSSFHKYAALICAPGLGLFCLLDLDEIRV